MALNLIKNIDPWIIERIIEPFYDLANKIGIWLYARGIWRIFTINPN
jgi:hypothetical protein